MGKKYDYPKLSNKFVFICNGHSPRLGAIAYSYVSTVGVYQPYFEFYPVTIGLDQSVGLENKTEYIMSIERGKVLSTRIRNILENIGGCENLVLVGLDEAQKSYLGFIYDYNLIEIENESDINFFLDGFRVDKEAVEVSEDNLIESLDYAIKNNKKLIIGNGQVRKDESKNKGVVVVEKSNDTSSVIGILYASTINANLILIEKPKESLNDIRLLIEEWEEDRDPKKYNEISSILYPIIESIEFEKYDYATFFTDSLPYSLILEKRIAFSYIDSKSYPDLFICNNVLNQFIEPANSSIIFSPLEFGNDEETMKIVDIFEKNKIYVEKLIGDSATVYNLDYSIKYYPFDNLHICSHGGEVWGINNLMDFTDSDGRKHQLEYDEVVSFAGDHSEEKIQVTSKFIWRKLNGLPWHEKPEFSHHVYDTMMNCVKDKDYPKISMRKEVIIGSCAIKCKSFHYQAMFNIIAGWFTIPFVFNNTCYSIYEIPNSFITTGARGYLGTLWAINNQYAKRFSEKFYENLEPGDSISECLRETEEYHLGHKDTKVYLFFGCHFTTIPESEGMGKFRVAKRISTGFKQWTDFYRVDRSSESKETGRTILRWHSRKINEDFSNEFRILQHLGL